jgi:hypothetical protein
LHIQQVLLHIIDNAIKYTDTGGVVVTVDARPEDTGSYLVTLAVRDSGIGMAVPPEGLLQHDFSQAEDFLRRRHGGLGVGLTLSRRLLQLMHGDLQIESEEGVGTVVTITLLLPVAEPPSDLLERRPLAAVEPPPGHEETGEEWRESASPTILGEEELQLLSGLVSQLMDAFESDYPRAAELLDDIQEQYRNSEYQKDLAQLSDLLHRFDSDGVAELGQSILDRLAPRRP